MDDRDIFPAQRSGTRRNGPVRPFRLLKIFAAQAFWRVLLYGLVSGALLFLAALGLARVLGGGGIAGVGWWPLTTAFTILGLGLGALAGLASAAGCAVRAAEGDVRDWLSRLSEADGQRIFPTFEVDQLQSGYDEAIASVYDGTLGRLPLPALIRRRVESKMRHAIVEDFLQACRAHGATTIGFADVRDFLLQKGLPLVTRPAHAQLRIGMLFLFGIAGVCLAAPVLIALFAGAANPRLVVIGTSTLAGVLVLFFGWRRADAYPLPWRRRLGVLIVGSGLALWPIIWIELWPHDLGMVWIVVLAATVWTFQRGARMALLEASGLTLRTFHRVAR